MSLKETTHQKTHAKSKKPSLGYRGRPQSPDSEDLDVGGVGGCLKWKVVSSLFEKGKQSQEISRAGLSECSSFSHVGLFKFKFIPILNEISKSSFSVTRAMV